MADRLYRIELTACFLQRLESIEVFLREADAPHAYDTLLEDLRETVIPNLRRFPFMGPRYLDQPPQSAEAIVQLGQLPPGAADSLRTLANGDYVILYTGQESNTTAYLLSIRQLGFGFDRP
ncbi:MAG: type II toxin-antitoxin system RelE/ParE family toxin [Burkholderiaceae bacterium]